MIPQATRKTPDQQRRLLLLGAAGLLAPPAWAASPPPTDLMPAFWAAYDANREGPAAERANRLLAMYFEPRRETFAKAGIRRLNAPAIASWLARFDPMENAVRLLHTRFRADHAAYVDRFMQAFPDFDANASPVFLMPSLFGFDAHLEPDGARLPLYFGLDGMLLYHGPQADLGVLFAHEIFHCYQAQKNPAMSLDPKAPVFASLWMEGVATLVSEQLNPAATPLNVLLDDERLFREGPAAVKRAAAVLLERLESTAEEDQLAFFSSGAKVTEWPPRMGYYVGLLAARRIARSMPAAAMAALPSPLVRDRLRAELLLIQAG